MDPVEPQPPNGAGSNHTQSSYTYRKAPRFLAPVRKNPEPTDSSTTTTSRVTQSTSRIVDEIESDDTPPPPPANVAAKSTSRITKPPSRFIDRIESDDTPPPPPANVAAKTTSRATGLTSRFFNRIESGDTPPPPPANVTTKPTSRATGLTSRFFNRIESGNTPPSASRNLQQPMLQHARNIGPTTASSSRITQQTTFRPVRPTAAPATTAPPSASATVKEFICLYTHDLRRKTKRWQDGKLIFHAFNKKVMVYDEGGGFVGDGHWQGDESEVAEGLEMNLDRGMAIVQVLECTGSKEQDLGEVLGKRAREGRGGMELPCHGFAGHGPTTP
ncbi:hypothetical protein V8C35DRAFT_162294 [Trichoderma chlorosporum]